MSFEERKTLISNVEVLRPGRKMVCLFNFDRTSEPQVSLGLDTTFQADTKEALFRVLKETKSAKIDLCIYTRGGDVNGVWPLVSMVREFDPDFEAIVPFRCHSAGTLLALGAKKIVLGPLSELSPIDPSTGNMFNPLAPGEVQGARLAISVEDVRAYRSFVLEQFRVGTEAEPEVLRQHLGPYLERLAHEVHPLALGNVDRVQRLVKQLAANLLALHPVGGRSIEAVIEAFTSRFWSHLHMVNRHEARDILGEQVEFTSPELAAALDELLRGYEGPFALRRPFFLNAFMGDESVKDGRFVGGALESTAWSYLHRTTATVRQSSVIPPNIQIQLPLGQPMPIVLGLARTFQIEVKARGWVHNSEPTGFDT